MNGYRYFLGFLLFSLTIVDVGQGMAESKIILVEAAKHVDDQAVVEAAKCSSEKNEDGGYNANSSVMDCFATMKYRYTGGRYVDEPILFRLYSPETIERDKKYPLIVWLHGTGESGSDNKRHLSHMQFTIEYLAGKKRLDFYMIVLQCPLDNSTWEPSISNEGQGDARLTIVHEILETMLDEYPVDQNRLGVIGVCSGGSAAWSYVAQYPDRFAAMATCSATPPNISPAIFTNTAVWTFNNKDDFVPYAETEKFIRDINALGGNAYFTLNKYGGHDSWSGALRDSKVIGWMVLQDLKKGGPPAGVTYYHRTWKRVVAMFGIPIAIIVMIPLLRWKFPLSRKH